jgi:hypothetical protein
LFINRGFIKSPTCLVGGDNQAGRVRTLSHNFKFFARNILN